MFRLERIASRDSWKKYRQMVLETPFTSFTLLPEWLEGYCLVPLIIRKIGFLIYNKNNDLIGGIAGVTYWLGRKITIFPSDPIIKDDLKLEIQLEEILKEILRSVKGQVHISSSVENPKKVGLKKVKFPKGFYPDPGLGSIRIEKGKDILTILKPKVRRDIRLSERRGVRVKRVNDSKELYNVYTLFAMNAKNYGYNIRPFFMFNRMWKRMYNSETGLFAFAEVDNQIKGAIWLIKSGESLHYIMGASLKEEVERNVGYALQFWALSESKKLGFNTYNISIGGPKGVEKFKDDFGRNKILMKKSYVGFF